MIFERTFAIDNAAIVVTIEWDNGDSSSGIGAGWGERTGAVVKVGPIYCFFGVEPDDKPVEQWRLVEAQLCYEGEPNPHGQCPLKLLADEMGPEEQHCTLAETPIICRVIKETWEQFQAQRELESAADGCRGCEEMVALVTEEVEATANGYPRTSAEAGHTRSRKGGC